MLEMTDEAGKDTKIIAVPCKKLTPLYNHVEEYNDLPQALLDKVEHFFQNYKSLEKDKWVKIEKWLSAADAKHEITKAIAAYV